MNADELVKYTVPFNFITSSHPDDSMSVFPSPKSKEDKPKAWDW